jgi:hypothetical protein
MLRIGESKNYKEYSLDNVNIYHSLERLSRVTNEELYFVSILFNGSYHTYKAMNDRIMNSAVQKMRKAVVWGLIYGTGSAFSWPEENPVRRTGISAEIRNRHLPNTSQKRSCTAWSKRSDNAYRSFPTYRLISRKRHPIPYHRPTTFEIFLTGGDAAKDLNHSENPKVLKGKIKANYASHLEVSGRLFREWSGQ